MNIIEGLNIQGFQLDVAENFNSVPGLKIWIDGRYRIQSDGSDLISSVGDLSPGIREYRSSGSSRPELSNADGFNFIKSIRSSGVNQALRDSNTRDGYYNFLHNGSAFGVFTIVDLATANTTAIELFHAFGISSSANNIGYCCRYREDLNWWTFNIFNGAGGVMGSSLSHNITRDVKNQPELIQHIYKGAGATGNDSEVYVNKTFISSAETSANPHSTDSTDVLFTLFRSSDDSGGEGRGYLTLGYDWSGKTPTEISAYRTSIQAMIYSIYGTILPAS